jgi:nickel-dependent lactate racemase
MQIVLSYGRDGLPLDLPDEWDVRVIRKPKMPVLTDGVESVTSALSNPVAAKPLMELAKGRKTACIAICDITRPVPNSIFLPAIIRQLIDAGIDKQSITVLVATGLHRPCEGEELRRLIGDDWVLKNIRVENHFACNDEDHTHLGTTSRGTPVRIDRRFVDAGLRIVTGLVEPHLMAGYSGGRKLIAPGIAHARTIARIHSAEYLENPNATNCVLSGNPVHEDQMEIMGMVGDVFALNTVIDEHRRLSYVNFGEAEASHLAAVDYLNRYAIIPVTERFATVVTTCAGYPLDATFYQACKGMVAVMDLVERGGNLFIASECSEGMGSGEFVKSQKCFLDLGLDGYLKHILARGHAEIDEWGTQMQVKAMKHARVSLFSTGLCNEDMVLTGLKPIPSLVDAIRDSVEKSGDDRVAVVPEGPYVVPMVSAIGSSKSQSAVKTV